MSCCAWITSRGLGELAATNEQTISMSTKGDFKQIVRRAEIQGWRVEKRKEYWLFFPPDPREKPCKLAGTPSSSRSLANFLACMKQKGYKR
jgi:hypothetical protein